MALIPVAAIVIVLVLFRRERDESTAGTSEDH
jgi:hypothetical protein